MWIFTEYGFFSVVANRRHPKRVIVRGRVLADLDAFADAAKLPRTMILVLKNADYRYRLDMSKKRLAWVMAKTIRDMTYDNFKNRVADTLGHDRGGIYLNTWSQLKRQLGNADEANPRSRGPGQILRRYRGSVS